MKHKDLERIAYYTKIKNQMRNIVHYVGILKSNELNEYVKGLYANFHKLFVFNFIGCDL